DLRLMKHTVFLISLLLYAVIGAAAVPAALSGIPLIELPQKSDKNVFAIIISGDGGWMSIDRAVAKHLAGKGIGTVGWNSLKYFWDAKTPDQISKDLNRVILYYVSAWKKQKVVVMGYSMGADAVPFMVNRLPSSTRKFIQAL